MQEEITNMNNSFDQVNEEECETERDTSLSKLNPSMSPKSSRNRQIVKAQDVSYYDSSDSDQNEADEQGDSNKKHDHKAKNKQSRLSQLSKYNLFALIQLANAWLVIRIQHNLDKALQIWNEALSSLKTLSAKVGSQIIAQELIELLISEIMDYKTKELNLDDTEDYTGIGTNNYQEQEEIDQEDQVPADEKIIAKSESVDLFPVDVSSQGQQAQSVKINHTKLNTRAIILSKDFEQIMAITTIVPFIKSGIPRLSEYDVKMAKLNEKGLSKKNAQFLLSTKIFQGNMDLRNEIYRWFEENLARQIDSPQKENAENKDNADAILVDDKDKLSTVQNPPEVDLEEDAKVNAKSNEKSK